MKVVLGLLFILALSTAYHRPHLFSGGPLKFLKLEEIKLESESRKAIAKCVLLASIAFSPFSALARPEGVNRPDLLPKEQTAVIDVANFLSNSQEKKIVGAISELEKATGYKLRVLCQRYYKFNNYNRF